jgi:hypothetical protein
VTAVLFTRRANDYAVQFPYSPALVAIIKQTVPGYARSFDPPSKVWTVETMWAPVLAAALRAHGYTVTGIDPAPPRCGHDDPTQWAHAVFRRVGPHRADRVYRALSRCLHPDMGGDTQLQQELNQAHAELAERKRPA